MTRKKQSRTGCEDEQACRMDLLEVYQMDFERDRSLVTVVPAMAVDVDVVLGVSSLRHRPTKGHVIAAESLGM